jgi:hypothetical protein
MRCYLVVAALLIAQGIALRPLLRPGAVSLEVRRSTAQFGARGGVHKPAAATAPNSGSRSFLSSLVPSKWLTKSSLSSALASKSAAASVHKASAQELRAILDSRSASKGGLLHKILFGINAEGRLSNWRVGDTRTDVSMLINGLSMAAILGVWVGAAYLLQRREEHQALRNLRNEVNREREYREVCLLHVHLVVISTKPALWTAVPMCIVEHVL